MCFFAMEGRVQLDYATSLLLGQTEQLLQVFSHENIPRSVDRANPTVKCGIQPNCSSHRSRTGIDGALRVRFEQK
jgi:hypothetical protein